MEVLNDMRIQLAILFVITAFLNYVLIQKSNATADVPLLNSTAEASHFIVMPTNPASVQPVIPITPPETLSLNEFSTINSTSQLNPEFSARNSTSQVIPEPIAAQHSSAYIVEPVNEVEVSSNSSEKSLLKSQPSPKIQTIQSVTPNQTTLIELAQDDQPVENLNTKSKQKISPPSSQKIARESTQNLGIVEPEQNTMPMMQKHSSQSIQVSEIPHSNIVHTSAQLLLSQPNSISQNSSETVPSAGEIQDLQNQLQNIEERVPDVEDFYRGSPSLTITTPSGFGADKNTGYIGASFVSKVRYSDKSDGALFLGVGLGDAQKSVGVEVSYTLASIFSDNTEFGRGGFNLKVHKQLKNDWAVAAGWNGFLNIGDNDFENSVYGTATKVIRLKDSVQKPLSRIAITAGVGNGQFRSEDDVDQDRGTVNVFGSVALRVVEPVSVIAEWTGQDLAIGASIVPIKNFPLVITPALRDIAGAGDGARFVLGTGFAFQF